MDSEEKSREYREELREIVFDNFSKDTPAGAPDAVEMLRMARELYTRHNFESPKG